MEKARLRPELQTIVEQFARFRNEYSSLKAHCAAQEELINLQKLELEQMHFSVEQLASTLIEYQKRFNTTLNHLESENQKLQKTVENLNRECENTRVNDNEYILEIHRNNDEYARRLEEHLEELRSKVAAQDEKHEDHTKFIEKRHNDEISAYKSKVELMDSMEKGHSEEISAYKTKLEQMNLSEKRHSEEISVYKTKLEQMNSSEKRRSEEMSAYEKKLEHMNSLQTRHNEEILACKRKIDNASNTMQESSAINKRKSECAHPALCENTGNKRKKLAPASYRWPPLDVSTKKEDASTEMTVQKKKRLYHADNETIVHLGS